MPLHFLSFFSPDAAPDCYAIRPKLQISKFFPHIYKLTL